MKPLIKWLALGLGLVLLGWYLSRLDPAAVADALQRLGWLAPLVLLPYLFVYVVDCLAWRLAFPGSPGVRFSTLFRIRWAGESLNNVVPSGQIGGEALKVYLLQKAGVPPHAATPSVVVSKTAQTVAQVLFISVASAAFLYVGGNNPGLHVGMFIVLLCGIVLVAGLFWVQRRGLLSVLLAVMRSLRLRFRPLEGLRPKIAALDTAISQFYGRHPRCFVASAGVYFCGWMLDTIEIYLVSYLLGMPITWWQALCVEAFTGVAKVLGMWMPASLGVQESGIVLLGRLAGLRDPLSFTYALLRRVREAIFVVIGLSFLYVREGRGWRAPVIALQKHGRSADAE
jgi:putative membrane protein